MTFFIDQNKGEWSQVKKKKHVIKKIKKNEVVHIYYVYIVISGLIYINYSYYVNFKVYMY